MNSKRASVNKIITFSCVDGPGNRLVIFFQGCNFQCQTCHNPYTIGVCNHCGDCIDGCPGEALNLDAEGRIQWHSNLCTRCDKCLDICPIFASPKTASYSTAELLEIIRDNQRFISGITLSGGEATVQLPFIVELLKTIKADPELGHLSCLLDSNGSLTESGWEQLLPHIDGVMLDIKAWNDDRHRSLTGAGNHEVLQSLQLLAAAGKLFEVRLLVIPDKTDFEDNLDALSRMLLDLPVTPVIRINAFQHHGVMGDAGDWPGATRSQVENFAAQLQDAGINNLVLPSVYLENCQASG